MEIISMQNEEISRNSLDRHSAERERCHETRRSSQMHHDSMRMAALTALLPVYIGLEKKQGLSQSEHERIQRVCNYIQSELEESVGIKQV